MAVTGLILFGYCVGHVAGNLLIVAGKDAINEYANCPVGCGAINGGRIGQPVRSGSTALRSQ